MDVHTWRQLFCVTSSLLMCNACMMFMQVISTCCHFSLNNVQVFTRWSLQVVDNWCLLQSLKDSLYYAILSDCVQLWTGWLTELDGWMSTSRTSTTNTPLISYFMTACFLHPFPPLSSLFSTCSITSSPPSGEASPPSHSTTSSVMRTCLRSWVSPPTHRSYRCTSRSSLLASAE